MLVKNKELDFALGKKKFLDYNTSFADKKVLIVRASSYGDYFFVAPVIKVIKDKYKCEIIYVGNGGLDSEYIKQNLNISEFISVYKLNKEWQDEKFAIEEIDVKRLLSILDDKDLVLLSYEGTDGDYQFGDMSQNIFEHYLEAAGFDFKDVGIFKDYILDQYEKSKCLQYLSDSLLKPFSYIVFHPYSSQGGRCWSSDKLNEFLLKYSLSFPSTPLVILGGKENKKHVEYPIIDLSGIPFLRSIYLTYFSKFGIFTESCMMHVGQSLLKPSIITHLHPWTARLTEPYHKNTHQIISDGYPTWSIDLLLQTVKNFLYLY